MSCAQHRCQSTLAGPAVVVPRLNCRKGVAPTATSKLPPVYTVGTAVELSHVSPLASTFRLFVADNPVRAIQVFPKLLRASQERWEHWFNHVFSHCDDAGTCCCSSKG